MKISMNYFTIFMLVMILCCVSAVSATDINGTDDVSDEIADVIEDVEIDDVTEDIIEEDLSVNSVTITESNYDDYFDSNGYLTADDTDLTFDGDFSSKSFGNFKLNNTVTVDASTATFNNVGFDFTVSGSKITGGVFNADSSATNTAIIKVTASDVEINGLTINVTSTPTTSDYFAISILNANYAKLLNNAINYVVGTATTNYNHVVRVVSSSGVTAYKNNITAYLPLKAVDFDQVFPSIYTDQVAGVAVQESDNFNFTGNKLDVTGNSILGFYPTLDALIIVQSENSHIASNTINLRDIVSDEGDTNYLYAVDIYQCNGIVVDNNVININSDGGNLTLNGTGAAYGVQLTGSHTGVVISNNNITTANNGPNLGIYSQNYYGETSLTITGNNINVTGRAGTHPWALVSGMELQDTNAVVSGNTIVVNNIAGYDPDYCAYGISYSQSTGEDHTFEVYNNTVTVENGQYAVFLNGVSYSLVYENCLDTTVYCCDNAVYVSGTYNEYYDNYCSQCSDCSCNP